MLLSLLLFGSRARGDHRITSDVDLLGLIEDGPIREPVRTRGTSFYCYPVKSLRQMAERGDLFFLHLREEGRLLHDSAGIFEDIKRAFEYKQNYRHEVREASAVIWYLAENPRKVREDLMRRHLVWALRTILIARSAEARTPIFSSSALSEFAQAPELKEAIDKRSVFPMAELLGAATTVARRFGLSRSRLSFPDAAREQRKLLWHIGGVAASVAGSMKGQRSRRPAATKPPAPALYSSKK